MVRITKYEFKVGNSVKVEGTVIKFKGKILEINNAFAIVVGKNELKDKGNIEVIKLALKGVEFNISRTRLPKTFSQQLDKYIKVNNLTKSSEGVQRKGTKLSTKSRDELYTQLLEDLVGKYYYTTNTTGRMDLRKEGDSRLEIIVSFDDDERKRRLKNVDNLNLKSSLDANGYSHYSQDELKREVKVQWERIYKTKLPDGEELVRNMGEAIKSVEEKYYLDDYGEEFYIQVIYTLELQDIDNEELIKKVSRSLIHRALVKKK